MLRSGWWVLGVEGKDHNRTAFALALAGYLQESSLSIVHLICGVKIRNCRQSTHVGDNVPIIGISDVSQVQVSQVGLFFLLASPETSLFRGKFTTNLLI